MKHEGRSKLIRRSGEDSIIFKGGIDDLLRIERGGF